MKNFILFLAIVCGGVSITFYTASKEVANGMGKQFVFGQSLTFTLPKSAAIGFCGGRLGSTLAPYGVCVGNTRLSETSISAHSHSSTARHSGRGKQMILVLINVLIIVVVGALIFYLIDRFVRDGRLANLLKILVVLICLAAILQRLLPALGVSLF